MPGLIMSGTAAYAQPAIRGVTTSSSIAGNDANVAIYLDGVYQSSQLMGVFDLPDITEIQVLRGPQGTLFGRNATGGAILLSSRDPEFETHVDAGSDFSFYDNRGGNLSTRVFATDKLNDTTAASISLYRQDGTGYYRDYITGEGFGNSNDSVARAKLLWEPDSDTHMQHMLFTAFYTRRSDDAAEVGSNPTGLGLAFSIDPALPKPSNVYDIAFDTRPQAKIETSGASIRGEFTFNSMKLTSLTAYNRLTDDTTADLDLSPLPILSGHFPSPTTMVSHEFDLASLDGGRLSWVTGVYLYYQDATQFQILNVSPYPEVGRVTTRAAAAFGEANYGAFDNLVLTDRRKTSNPSSCSSFLICSLNPDWATPNDREAAEKDSSSAILTNAAIWQGQWG